jgi:hypothetical protein
LTDAEIFASALVDTPIVVIVKVVLVAPPGMVAEAATEAVGSSDERATGNPDFGAGLLIVTVPVDVVPPITEVGLRDTDLMVGAVRLTAAETVEPFDVAEIFAVVGAATATVVTVKVVVVAPPATVADAGTVAAALSEDSGMDKPDAGAGLLRVIVPVELIPPNPEVGDKIKLLRTGPEMARGALAFVPFAAAVMLAVALGETATVETFTVAVFDPAANLTVAGTVAAALSDDRLTVYPFEGAVLAKVIVATDGAPPSTPVGLRVTEATAGALTISEPLVETLDAVAVMFAVKFTVVDVEVAVKVAEFVPAATVTEAGT